MQLINKTKYIIKDLLTHGLISEDRVDEAERIINQQGKFSKELKVKESILYYLKAYSSSFVTEADLDTVYSNILAKFKEGVDIANEHVKVEVIAYLKKESKSNSEEYPWDKFFNDFSEVFNTPPKKVINRYTLYKN